MGQAILKPSRGAAVRVALTLADQGVVSATSFLTGVLVAKLTNKDQVGLYGLGWMAVMIVTELQSALIATPQTVFGPRYDGQRNRQFQGSMLLKLLLLAGFNTLLLAAAALETAIIGKGDLSKVLLALAVGVTALHLCAFARTACFAHLNPLGALLVDLASCSMQLLALGLLWKFNALSGWSAWLVINLTSLPPAIAFLVWWWPNMSFSLAGAKEDFWLTWRQTRWVLASSILWVGGMHLYPAVIEAFASRAEVAVWTVCFAISAIGNPLMYGVMNMLGPQIAHRHARLSIREFQHYAWRAAAAFAAVMSCFALLVTVLAEWLIVHLYGAEYSGHRAVVAMLAFGLAARVPGFVAARGLFVLHRADLELLNNIAPLALMLLLGVMLTDQYGAWGAALSLLLAQCLGSVTRIICFRRIVRQRATDETAEPATALGVMP